MEVPIMTSARALEKSAVLITGGTSGVGLATARRFAEAGVPQIAIVGRNATRGEQACAAVKELHPGVDVVFIAGDAHVASEATRIAAATHARFGRIDVLVNSTVGPYPPALLHNTAIEDIQLILLGQIMGPLLMSAAVLPVMREAGGGVILNISSDAGKLATPGEAVIGAAMAGIVMFSRTLAIEAKRDGIRVNALTPSLIEGTLTNDRMMQDAFATKLFEKARAAASLGVVVPDDMADLIVFLASPQAARITGQAISVNGGISAA
jgi:NAD(P)-dependent dehydrogenase (short-subunit alcohol dehydrogenase family)